MAKTAVEPEETPATEPETGPGTESGTDWEAEAKKWRELSRQNEAQAKKNADAAKRLEEIEDAERSEIEKLQNRAAEAEKRAEENERKALRLEVAQDKGLSLAQAKRLQGSTKEELEADAEDLLAAFTTQTEEDPPKPSPSTPKSKLRSGTDPETDETDVDPEAIADQIRSAGRL